MSKFYLISGILGFNGDVSPNMISSILDSDILFVEELRLFDLFLERNNIDFKGKALEMGIDNSKYKKDIMKLFLKGLNIGIFESSGIPCFVDPGLDLVQFIYDLKNKDFDIEIVYIPGSSALTAGMSVCGFDVDKFSFLYFVSKDTKKEVLGSSIPVIYFINHIGFENLLGYLSFMKNEHKRKVFCGVNIAKKMPSGEKIIRDTFDKVYHEIEKIYNECIEKREIPDIMLVFNN